MKDFVKLKKRYLHVYIRKPTLDHNSLGIATQHAYLRCKMTPYYMYAFITSAVNWGKFGQLRNFCHFLTRELHLNGSDSLGILRQPFESLSCRKCGSNINVVMSEIIFNLVNFLAS